MHPRYGLEREYVARIRGALQSYEEKKLLQGIDLDGVPARFESVRSDRAERRDQPLVPGGAEGRAETARCGACSRPLGHPVSRLVRVRYGPLELPADLAPGRWRELRNPVILQKL